MQYGSLAIALCTVCLQHTLIDYTMYLPVCVAAAALTKELCLLKCVDKLYIDSDSRAQGPDFYLQSGLLLC